MYSSSNFLQFHSTATTTAIPIPNASPFMLRRSSYGFGVFHRKRARFKQQTRSSFRVNSSILPPPFDGSVPLDSFAPSVAGFASGFAVFLSSRLFGRRRSIDDDNIVVGEWILLTTPTPFNRFVLLRCSSLLSFDDSSESLSDRLVTDERHFVTSDTGKITVSSPDEKTPLEYQRVCITTEDGGVVSLDWPANLDIKEERGMDTTVIFIPGTPQGSMDEGVRSFVCEALRRGLFPVVMNPRGCAGSPLTTPRLFTAGDSDDVSTALRFLTKTRPWTTLAAVGRGYGANMLTKYLAEAGERSPLSAAVCIDNPFDLEEITRTSPYSTSLDQRITGGLVEILLANKELFQGRAKAFDVGKALSSKSVREFDTALSMVTYGCESIEDFYSSCATRDVIGEVKVPVLFIQNDNVVPPYTIPRSSIAENPYTSLLLCSSSPNLIDGRTLAVSWCQDLAIEWLTAVELALLKGRHPLLKDVDVTVNPSKGLVFSEARAPEKSIGAKKLVQAAQEKTVNGYHVDPFKETLEDSDITPNSNLSTGTDLEKNVKVDNGSDETENSSVSSSSLVEVESIEDNESNVEESERGQVLQTAEVVVNMLDVTMPGTLKDEEKKKVMDAVGRGETVLTALQDAVPEDVRGKITTAVTGILESGGTKLNLEKLKLPRISPGLKKAEEAKEEPSSAIDQKDSHSPNPIDKSDGLVSGSDDTITGSDNSPGGIELEHSPTEVSQKDGDSGNSQPVDSDQDDSLGNHESYTNEKNSAADGSENASEAKSDSANQGPIGTEDVTSNDDKVEQGSGVDTLQRQVETKKHDEKEAPIAEEKSSVADAFEKASDTKNDSINPPPVVVDDITSDGDKVDQAAVLSQQQRKEETNKNNDKEKQSATDQDKVTSTDNEGDAGKSSASQPVEKDISDDQSKETKIMQPVSDQTNPAIQEPNQSKFDVSHAFEALTGMDDETQVAVNSVFGVLENMISQLDEENKEGNEVSDEKNLKDTKTLKDEKNVTNEAMSPSEEEIPDKRETESLMPSENSHDPACSVSETEKSSGNDKVTGEMIEKDLGRDEFVNGKHSSKVLPERNTDSVENSSHDGYRGYRGEKLSKEKIAKQLDLDTTTALMLDYYPEEGEWKLLDQQPEHLDNDYYPEAGKWKLLDQQPEYLGNLAENAAASRDTHGNVQVHSLSVGNEDNIIEPAYVILDHGQESELSEMHDATDNQNDGPHKLDEGCKELEHLIKVIVSDSLNVEVQRRMGSAGMRQIKSQLSKDIRMVAKTFSYSVVYAEPTWTFIRNSKTSNGPSGKVGKLHGDAIIRAIASAVQEAHFLRQVLPIGVVVGSVLAALRKYFDVSTTTNSAKRDIVPGRTQKYENNGAAKRVLPDKVSKETQQNNSTIGEMVESGLQNINNEGVMVSDNGATTSVVPSKVSKESKQNNSTIGEMVESGLQSINNEGVMVGAVTAALGASAMLAQDEDPQRGGFMSKPSDSQHTESGKLDQSNMVASFAEKAMSIAGPAVPTKETGEVDQDRIVAMLADLGQRGGILKLVGKLALLWGGLRGAMSLTDKLIQFLRMDEWPLLKRAVGFIGMLLVLWSPVVIPLLPTLLQSWSTSNPSRVAELASVVGLYVAIFILVMLWGKRVRKYENPFMQYGLDFKASVKVKIQVFLKAFAGGMTVVLLIQFVNAILGAAIFSRPPYFPHPFDAMKCLKGCGQLLMLIVRGFTAATFVVLVEELLFRSWMPDEIAIDLGYHQSIIITGFIFALFQRSLRSIPGLWLLSLALAGARTRSQGNLIVPIGLRAGTIATSFLLQSGGFLFYNPSSPAWIAGSRPLQPFSGVVGLVVSLALALILYPRHSPETKLQKYN